MKLLLLLLLVPFACAGPSIKDEIIPANALFGESITFAYANYMVAHQPTREDPLRFANATFFGASPAIDNRISSLESTNVLYASAVSYDDVQVDYPSDHLKCRNEYGTRDTASYTFGEYNRTTWFEAQFRNVTRSWDVSSFASVAGIPFSTEELEESEFDPINLTMHSIIQVPYRVRVVSMVFSSDTDPVSGATSEGCDPVIEEYDGSLTYSFNESKIYLVESTKILSRTIAPALKEQWFRNNRFDSLVFSNRLFYKARVENATDEWYMFELRTGAIGYVYGVSVPTNSSFGITHEEYINRTNPYLLDSKNGTYGVAYRINHTLVSAAGIYSRELILTDHFGNEFLHNETFISRSIAKGNASELGSEEFIRPHARELDAPFQTFELSLGILWLVMLFGIIPRIMR